jgi:hypothetical protein
MTPWSDEFAAAILEKEVVLRHIRDGHVFHFPILSDGTVSGQACRVESNPKGDREARSYLSDAYAAAQDAFSSSQSM